MQHVLPDAEQEFGKGGRGREATAVSVGIVEHLEIIRTVDLVQYTKCRQ